MYKNFLQYISFCTTRSFCVLAFIFVLFSPLAVFATTSTLSFPQKPAVGNVFFVDVLVDLLGENINSADMTISFSPEDFRFDGYDRDEGMIGLWVVAPHEKSPGTIAFSGVIPGGVERLYDPLRPNDKAVPLVRLRLIPLRETQATMRVASGTLLRNDGRGTALSPALGSLTTMIGPATPVQSVATNDQVPPLPFVIEQIEGSLLGRTPTMLVFETTDKESGISRYEVSINGSDFSVAQSPYPIPRRLLPYRVTVRAVDFAGNYQEAMVVLPGDSTTTRTVLVAIVAVIAIVIYVYRRRTARSS